MALDPAAPVYPGFVDLPRRLEFLPPAPPAFADVVQKVEQLPGVRFEALFARLPQRFLSGDAALQALWDMVLAEQRRRTPEGD